MLYWYALEHNLASVQILDLQAAFRTGSYYAAVYWVNLSDLPFTWGKSPTLQLATPSLHRYRASSMIYSWCETGGCNFLTTLLHPLFEPMFSNFDSSIKMTLSNSSIFPVFMPHRPLEIVAIVLLRQQWFFDSNSAI